MLRLEVFGFRLVRGIYCEVANEEEWQEMLGLTSMFQSRVCSISFRWVKSSGLPQDDGLVRRSSRLT